MQFIELKGALDHCHSTYKSNINLPVISYPGEKLVRLPQNQWGHFNNYLSLLLKNVWAKGVWSVAREGNQVHCHRVTSSLSSMGNLLFRLFPQVWGGYNSCTGHGVWWPDFGRPGGGDLLVTPRFQPNCWAGRWRTFHVAVCSLSELREGKQTYFPGARSRRVLGWRWLCLLWHVVSTPALFAHWTLC